MIYLEHEGYATHTREVKMAKATYKAPGIEALLSALTGVDRTVTISHDICIPTPIGCGGQAANFRDEISRKEYTISGLCQKCQDSIFGVNDEE